MTRILVAGIGNIFWGDDAFGVEVARRLSERTLPAGVKVVDFGIRGFDLAYALLADFDAAILLDVVRRGGAPGTLYVIEPEIDTGAEANPTAARVETHGMDPVRALRLVAALGGELQKLRLVGCEPARLGTDDEMSMGLSEEVASAVDPATRLVEELVASMQEEAQHA
jgi:hydrogenase maturation protease